VAFSKQDIQTIYDRHAKHYDFYVTLYRLIGFRFAAYRVRVVELLRLQPGDCVVELGCGTGLNFPLLMERIGPEGRVVGVDLSPEMLAYARERVARAGWQNVELVQADMAAYDFPNRVNRVLSTGALGYLTEYERVLERASKSLVAGGRLVILDGKRPEHWPPWLVKFFVWLMSPFGVTLEYFDAHPWESVARYFQEPAVEEVYGGLIYISSGTAPSPAPNT
jgi:ubiquinone/menaquinone biosynthesis C-methylase UbiE